MFAVIKTGGLQYKIAEDQVVRIGRIQGEPGEIVQLGDVMMLGGDTPLLGAPLISGASVAVEIMQQSRGPKVISFKKRRRKNSRRKRGHRQDYTMVRISEILTDGNAPTKKARGKPERKPKPEAVEGEEAAPKAAKKTAAKKTAAKKTAAKKPKAAAKKTASKGKKK